MMVAADSGAAPTTNWQNTEINSSQNDRAGRPPLLPSETDNSNRVSNNPRKPKSRMVPSRYLSSSTSSSTSNSSSVSSSSSSSRRYPSPLVPRNSTSASTTPSLVSKRSVSVDRRRPGVAKPLTPDLDPKHGNASDVSAAKKLLINSTRSLSVSFQGEAFSLPISKTKVASSSPNFSSVRKGTPERKRISTPSQGRSDVVGAQVENSKSSDQHRCPARNRLENPLSRSLNCNGAVGEMSNLIGSGNAIRALQQSMVGERRHSVDGRLSLDLGHSELPKEVKRTLDGNSINNKASMSSDLTASDSESVSSGSTSGVHDCRQASYRRNEPRGFVSSAKFWQETNSRLRRLQDPDPPLSTSPGSKLIVPPKLKQYRSNGSLSSPKRMPSPIRGGIRPASPSKLMAPVGSSPSCGHTPSRIRNDFSTTNNFTDTPSVLSIAVDVRRGKVGDNRIFDAHSLRLLYDQHLQWRFINARTEAVLLVQKRNAEKNLWNAWITISNLRDSVTKRRHRLQLLRQKLKLASISRGHMTLLEDWDSMKEDYSISFFGAIDALTACTLRVPIMGGATANIQSLQDVIGSAIDIMQATASSIHLLLPVVEEVTNLVTELAEVMKNQRALLEGCRDSISQLAAMQVKECSLRTHVIQLTKYEQHGNDTYNRPLYMLT